MKGFKREDVAYYFNQVRPSFIRLGADEVTYHFHIMIRFELEKDLIEGRLNVKELKNIVLIDDTYNSNTTSIQSAVELSNKIKKFPKKFIVLGDIFELGKYSGKIHKELAQLFRPNKNVTILTIGRMMKVLNKSLTQKKIKSIHFNSREELSLFLKYEEIENSVILIKGSRGMKMEEFLNILETRFGV